MRTLHSVPKAERGFTLVEILIALAIMAMLAGAAIPVASKALSSSARKATRVELVQLGLAAQEYFRDTHRTPKSLADLEHGTNVAGWDGPYVTGVSPDSSTSSSPHATDAWSREYRVKVAGDLLTITSAGPDESFDTTDDVEIQVDFTPIRREETAEELKAINQAIWLYNGLYGADQPLTSTWKTALPMLVEAGFLPRSDAYDADAWGNAYVGEPDGKTPLVKVISISMASTTTLDGQRGRGAVEHREGGAARADDSRDSRKKD